MKVRVWYYIFTYVIPFLSFLCCPFVENAIPCLVVFILSELYASNIKCPGCQTKIMSFYMPFSGHFRGELCRHIRLPDECPECGCVWE